MSEVERRGGGKEQVEGFGGCSWLYIRQSVACYIPDCWLKFRGQIWVISVSIKSLLSCWFYDDPCSFALREALCNTELILSAVCSVDFQKLFICKNKTKRFTKEKLYPVWFVFRINRTESSPLSLGGSSAAADTETSAKTNRKRLSGRGRCRGCDSSHMFSKRHLIVVLVGESTRWVSEMSTQAAEVHNTWRRTGKSEWLFFGYIRWYVIKNWPSCWPGVLLFLLSTLLSVKCLSVVREFDLQRCSSQYFLPFVFILLKRSLCRFRSSAVSQIFSHISLPTPVLLGFISQMKCHILGIICYVCEPDSQTGVTL